jgi:hypothetical protein
VRSPKPRMSPLGMEFRQPTKYRGGESVEIKVFLMERIATWLLWGRSGALNPRDNVWRHLRPIGIDRSRQLECRGVCATRQAQF